MTTMHFETADERDMRHWKAERACVQWAEVARDIWKDKAAELEWWKAAEGHRKARFPKDRAYSPIYQATGGGNSPNPA